MYLPIISIVIWCVLGVVVHGWRTLIYPLAWFAVAGGIFLLNYVYNKKTLAQQDESQAAQESNSSSTFASEGNRQPVLN